MPERAVERRRTGSTLLLVLIGAVVVSILASSAVPIYSTHDKLRRQEEFLFVLYSYKRGLELFKKDPLNGGKYPPSLAALLPTGQAGRRRYLRAPYVDPLTGKNPVEDPQGYFLDKDGTGTIANVRTRSQESLFETTPYSRWYFDEKFELKFLTEEQAAGAAP